MNSTSSALSLYIHIPFCAHKCPYCDFTTYAVPQPPESTYVTSLIEELRLCVQHFELQDKTLQTIFFGGGTPSFFSPQALRRVINAAREYVPQQKLQEVCIEANPEHVTSAFAEELLAQGVTRVSLGVQSLDDQVLAKLGRNHTAKRAVDAVQTLSGAGIKNLSLDLMYGTPGQTCELLERDLAVAAALPLNHISIYGLTIEAGTPFFVSHAKGDLALPHEEQSAQMYELLLQATARHGFERYEISNFAKTPQARSLHNMNYWQHGEYLGLGAGAHSFLRTRTHPLGVRWSNEATLHGYGQALLAKRLPSAWREVLTNKQALSEVFFVGLRMVEGVPFERALRHSGGVDPEVTYHRVFETLSSQGLLVLSPRQGVHLTPRGMQFLDTVLESFV